eukprot:gene9003-1616_t
MAKLLNVDPEKQADPFYRYKMPRSIAKVEGKGNGIKTVIPNIGDICAKLDRSTAYGMKYLGYELCCAAKFVDDKWILTGEFTPDRIQQVIFDFIKHFVLCQSCRNPETIMSVDTKATIWLDCKACAARNPITCDHQLANHIAKNEKPKTKDKKKAAGKTKDEKEHQKFDKVLREARAEDKCAPRAATAAPAHVFPTSTASSLRVLSAESTQPKVHPSTLLREFLDNQPPPTEMEIGTKVFDIKQDYGLKQEHLPLLVFDAVFTPGNIMEALPKRAKVFQRFLTPDTQACLLDHLFVFCAENEAVQQKFHVLVKKMYDLDYVSEDTILAWWKTWQSKMIALPCTCVALFFESFASDCTEYRVPIPWWYICASVFFCFSDWLGQDSEDDDDDDEEEADSDDSE